MGVQYVRTKNQNQVRKHGVTATFRVIRRRQSAHSIALFSHVRNQTDPPRFCFRAGGGGGGGGNGAHRERRLEEGASSAAVIVCVDNFCCHITIWYYTGVESVHSSTVQFIAADKSVPRAPKGDERKPNTKTKQPYKQQQGIDRVVVLGVWHVRTGDVVYASPHDAGHYFSCLHGFNLVTLIGQ